MGLKIYSEIINKEFSAEQIKFDFEDKLESFKPATIVFKLIKISKYRSYFFLYGENIIIAIKRKFFAEPAIDLLITILDMHKNLNCDLTIVINTNTFKIKKDKKLGSLSLKWTLSNPCFFIIKFETTSKNLSIEDSDIFSYCKEINFNINTIFDLMYKYREIISILDINRYFFIKYYFSYKTNHSYSFQKMLSNGLNKFILNELKNETEQLLIEYNVPENGPRISLVEGYKIINSLNSLLELTN